VHADAIAGMLTDPVVHVRYSALLTIGRFEQAALTLTAGAIVGVLADTDASVRTEAMMTLRRLRRLDPAALKFHAGAIAGEWLFDMLADASWGKRYEALYFLDMACEAMLAPDELARAFQVVTNMLTDDQYDVRNQAINTLRNLKRKRARLHWATARVYRVRWYGHCWYECALEKLCAPGGKWAERDRAAFEAEFI